MAQGKITDKQKEILEYIKECILKKGYPPTVREICERVKLKSTSSVHSHLEQLEKNGYIHRDPTKPRTIEIVDDTFKVLFLLFAFLFFHYAPSTNSSDFTSASSGNISRPLRSSNSIRKFIPSIFFKI